MLARTIQRHLPFAFVGIIYPTISYKRSNVQEKGIHLSSEIKALNETVGRNSRTLTVKPRLVAFNRG